MSYLLLMDIMAQPKIFTKIDLHAAYHLVKITSKNEFKFAFRCQYGYYEYTVMLFGLANAPSIFMRLVNSILHKHHFTNIFGFIVGKDGISMCTSKAQFIQLKKRIKLLKLTTNQRKQIVIVIVHL